MLCGGAAGGSPEDSRGGVALVFSQIPVLLEAFGLPRVRISEPGMAGVPVRRFLCSVMLCASSAGHWGSDECGGLMDGEKSWVQIGCN